MADSTHTLNKVELTEQLLTAVHEERDGLALQIISGLVPEEIAEILESSPPKDRHQVWQLLQPDIQGEVLGHTNDEVRANLLEQLDQHELVEITEDLETDKITDIAQVLTETEKQALLDQLPEEERSAVETALNYPDDTAGGLMSADFIAVRSDVTIEVVLRLLRKFETLPESTIEILVRDRDGAYQGVLKINNLLTHDEDTMVESLIENKPAIKAMTNEKEVAHLFEKNDLISAAVIDENNLILGRITIDDVVDIIREEAEHAQMAIAGLNEEEDLFASPIRAARTRSFWLGINLLTAVFAALVIGLFEATIDQIVALAILMPIVASMGGIAGTQTATIVVRALATGKLGSKNSRLLVIKETLVGSLNGVLWALLTGLAAGLWFQQISLGVIFGAAMFINLVAAALAGAIIPLILNKMKIDPALASGLMLTTVTDSLGFFVFLGLATIVLL